ncbi:ComEC/Rec2 family competence protein [Glaciihabitans arcticus]|uniref:ComEC/Rec2 family competence protein n=1 Tax=Glaciihabitans arcticus TaxID=2668039 RepID=A0A4Q9GWC1_9MICO|nr:ComEC/Rec2 family competence protein [Glaciihabitans arcticus]TBN56983.1 ComEC/Rec2 family competence protein [Glaciihabitans arcticus]
MFEHRVSDLRLLAPACAAWLAAGVVVALPDTAVVIALVLWATGAVLLVVLRRSTWAGLVAVCCVAGALCCTVIAVQQPLRRPEPLAEAAQAGRLASTRVVTQTTLGPARDGPWRATLVGYEVGKGAASVRLPVLVFGGLPPEEVGIGATIELRGTLAVTTPGDDAAFLVFAEGESRVSRAPPWFQDWANGLRARFREAASELPGDGGALLPGLAIGDTSAVDETLDAAMKASSLSHLTAVSGANCAIVIGLIMLAGGAVGLSRGWRVVASITVLIGFVVLVTPEPSVVRAAAMAILVLLALATGRPVRGMPVLSLAVLVLLASDPWLSRDYGFVLSVLATGGLLIVAGPLARLFARWMPSGLAAVLAVPVAAQLACQPVLILLTPSIPVFGVVANLLAEPAAPLATVVGLLACLGLVVVPPLGELLARIAWLPSAWISAVARFFGGLPGALPWLPGALGALLLAAVTALGLVAALGPGSARWRRWCALLSLALLVGHLGAVAGIRVHELLTRPGNWQIAACDIGQGDAVFVRSLGELALIDTGPEPERLGLCLDDLGIGRIDLLVLTHFDLDHVGGLDAILGRVDRVLVGPSGEAADDAIVAELVAGGARVERASRGLSGLLGELRWTVLWPRERSAVEPGNDASVAMTFEPVGGCVAGCLSSLFLGDLGERPQALMLAAGPIPRVDVVKVSHHGSADQNDRVYERAGATVGVIGVGADNDYGHPNPRLLDLLAAVHTSAVRTDRDGMVLLSPTAGGGVAVWTQKSGDGPDG